MAVVSSLYARVVSSLPLAELIIAFAAAAVATWAAGVVVSRASDVLADRLGLGEALAGMVLLAVSGTLPELAITVSASAAGHLGLVTGNLIGGIAMQTVVLVACDAVVSGDRPLSYRVGSMVPVFEAVVVIATVTIAVAGSLLPRSAALGPLSPASLLVVAAWLGGLALLVGVRGSRAWTRGFDDGHDRSPAPDDPVHRYRAMPTGRVVALFAGASAVTLAAGVALADAGGALADRAGISGVVFGATLLALVTALPEVSSGIAAVQLRDYEMAVGDIFGGNAFQLCLFVVADLVAGRPVLAHAARTDGWLGAVAVVLTAVYAVGVMARPTRRRLRLGPDSWAVLGLYALGIVGLVTLK